MELEYYGKLPELSPDGELDIELPSASELAAEPDVASVEPNAAESTAIEEADLFDDPVRQYLREIGRVALLTARDEKVLAKKIEVGRRLKQLRRGGSEADGESPSASRIVLMVWDDIGRAAPIVRVLREVLGLPATDSLVRGIAETSLRQSIDGVLDQKMVQDVADRLDKSTTETEHLLINLSLDCDLLPDEVLDTLERRRSASAAGGLEAGAVAVSSAVDARIKMFMENIERESARGEQSPD